MHGEQPFGVAQQPGAVLCRPPATLGAAEQGPSDPVLQALDLVADGRLGEVKPLSRPGHAAGFRDGLDGAQGFDVEAHDHFS